MKALACKEDFLRDLQFFRRLSDHTVSAYKRDLSLYEKFLSERAREGGGGGATDRASALYDFLREKGLSKRSVARLMSAVRSYFHWMESRSAGKEGGKAGESGKSGQNSEDGKSSEKESRRAARVAVDLALPRFHSPLPRPLSFKNFQALLSAAGNDKKEKRPELAERNRTVLLLLFGTGCRVSELTALNLRDFNETDSWIRVQGKGGRERLIPLSAVLNAAIVRYLKEARPLIARRQAGVARRQTAGARPIARRRAAAASPSLICNNRGRRPSRTDIWRWLKLWAAKAGLSDEALSPHSFRHGFASSLLEGGADLVSIQKLLGHKNIQTSQIYTKVSSRRMKETMQKHHPLSSRPVS